MHAVDVDMGKDMPNVCTLYGSEGRTAERLARAAGFDTSLYDHVELMFPAASCGWAGREHELDMIV